MGDRVRVTLSVLTEHVDTVTAIDDSFDSVKDIIVDGVDVSVMSFEAVSGGRLSIETKLVDKNIPYSLSWAGGDEIEQGHCVHHKTEGKWVTHTFNEVERGVICLKGLLDAHANGTQPEYIEYEMKKQSQFTIDWSSQT